MSVTVKLANVLLSDETQFLQVPGLLCRADRPFLRDAEEGSWRLSGAGTFDFTTFFNGLSVRKWRAYTVAERFSLHLELRGAASRLALTWADALSFDSAEISARELPASQDWQALDIELPLRERDVLESFKLTTSGDVWMRNAYYYTEVEEADLRPVELALCTTTIKKEAYVQRNVRLVRTHLLESSEPIADHLQMHVVDNGRTLDVEALSGGGVTVHPNDNAGGAGGFARGMIEAMEQTPRATHVLLMDDDVVVSPESILRTYNLLRIVNDRYAEAFVSGAMMSLGDPGLRWEDLGYVGFDGKFYMIKPQARMDYFNEVVNSETCEIPEGVPGCEATANHYAAWWYCVIPMTQIERNGLPLPIFVRGDDVEYSRRCKPLFMTMNGICIWHPAFDIRYNAAQERYQMNRNCLLIQNTTDVAPGADFIGAIRHDFELDLKKFDYQDAELTLRGFEDFLRGPEWIMRPVAEDAFLQANRDAEKVVPIEQLKDQAAELGVDLDEVDHWNLVRDLPRSRKEGLRDFLSIGGNRFTGSQVQKGKVAVIDHVGWAYPAGKLHGAEYVIALDIPSRRGVIRHVDRQRFHELWERYRRAMREYRARRDELAVAYREARPEMTSVEFWKRYLGLEPDDRASRREE